MNTSKKPIIVNFCGLPGAGKTTIRKSLKKQLDDDGVKVKTMDDVKAEFLKENRFTRHVNPILLHPLKTIHAAQFVLGNKQYGLFPVMLSQNYTISRADTNFAQFIFDDESLFRLNIFAKHNVDPEQLLNAYPDNDIIFIYLNIPHTVAFKRMKSRSTKEDLKVDMAKKGDEWGLNRYLELNHSYQKMLNIVEQSCRQTKRIRVVQVDSQNPLEFNIQLLKDELHQVLDS